jgi:hypothetical protein
MNTRLAMEDAVQRLTIALDALEAAVHRRKANEETIRELEEDVHLLALDRSKLASELDDMAARARGLEMAAHQASQRVNRAMDTIREILVSNGR